MKQKKTQFTNGNKIRVKSIVVNVGISIIANGDVSMLNNDNALINYLLNQLAEKDQVIRELKQKETNIDQKICLI